MDIVCTMYCINTYLQKKSAIENSKIREGDRGSQRLVGLFPKNTYVLVVPYVPNTNHGCQKILEMDCLIDQLGQSKKAKQGPLKVIAIHLGNAHWKADI